MKTLAEFDNFLKNLSIKSRLETGGWANVVHDVSVAAGEMVFVYIYDAATKWTWMAGVDRGSFQDAAAGGGKMKQAEKEMLRNALTMAILDLIKAADGDPDRSDKERLLGLAMAMYAGGTETFRLSNQFREGGHFCVVVYRKNEQATNAFLRPFSLTDGTNKPLSADSFLNTIAQVIKMDSARHPDWVAGA